MIAHRIIAAGTIAAALLLAGWALLPSAETPRERAAVDAPAAKALTEGRAAPAIAAAAEPAGAPASPGIVPAPTSPQPDSTGEAPAHSDKAALAELAAAERDDDEPSIEPWQGPRPGAEELPEISSRMERSMSAEEKAAQTDRLVLRLSERSERLRLQLQQAREEGDEAESRRRQLMLSRLDRRVQGLRERSSAWHEHDRGSEP